jgi:transposase
VFVDVVGMANDDTHTPADLVGRSYEARKSAVRGGAGAGVEVRVRAVRRRRWSAEEKLRIVREALEPGAVAKAVADRHGIGTGLLFTWRREMLAAAMSGFAPVEVVPEIPRIEAPAPAPAQEAAPEAPGTVEVAFPSGATVRVSGRVELDLLRGVLAELGGGR